ncbi:uncharacterized protein [Argopecten irradians]|uniref:uncharacterized protein n=1 Tax=Argopecten irradians TaxID=31199 RepID=UPI003716C69E
MSRCTLILTVCWIVSILCVSFTSSNMIPKPNIEALNRLIRERLFMKVVPELRTVLDSLERNQAATSSCQQQITRSYKLCAQCTNSVCSDRYKTCKIRSKKRLSLCDVVGFNQRQICEMTDKKERFMLNVVTNMKNKLAANLRYAIYDMGQLVEQFLVQLGNYANTWSSPAAFSVQNAIKQIQTRYTIENDRWSADINYLSPEEQILRDMASAINIGMDKLGATVPNTGSFSYDFSRTLADLLSVHFHVGRKKRAAVSCTDLATGAATCLSFLDQCPRCASSPTTNPITAACGTTYVSNAKLLIDSLTRTTQIFEDVLSRVGFIESALYNTRTNVPDISFPNSKFTVHVQGQPTVLYADFHVFRMPFTATQLANKIWTEWMKKIQ